MTEDFTILTSEEDPMLNNVPEYITPYFSYVKDSLIGLKKDLKHIINIPMSSSQIHHVVSEDNYTFKQGSIDVFLQGSLNNKYFKKNKCKFIYDNLEFISFHFMYDYNVDYETGNVNIVFPVQVEVFFSISYPITDLEEYDSYDSFSREVDKLLQEHFEFNGKSSITYDWSITNIDRTIINEED